MAKGILSGSLSQGSTSECLVKLYRILIFDIFNTPAVTVYIEMNCYLPLLIWTSIIRTPLCCVNRLLKQ